MSDKAGNDETTKDGHAFEGNGTDKDQSSVDTAEGNDAPDTNLKGIKKGISNLFKRAKKRGDSKTEDADAIEAGFNPDTNKQKPSGEADLSKGPKPQSGASSGMTPSPRGSTASLPNNQQPSDKASGDGQSKTNPNNVALCDLNYDYNTTRKGLMIIILNDIFILSSSRKGAEQDLNMLKDIATKLKFHYVVIRNKIKQYIDDAINAISKWDLSSYDCFIFVVSSHGNEILDKKTGQWDHVFFSADDEKLYTRDIINLFDEKSCQTLKDKPKLFFIQACRGKGTDDGVTVNVPGMPPSNPWQRPEPDAPDVNVKDQSMELVLDEKKMPLVQKRPTSSNSQSPSDDTHAAKQAETQAASGDSAGAKGHVTTPVTMTEHDPQTATRTSTKEDVTNVDVIKEIAGDKEMIKTSAMPLDKETKGIDTPDAGWRSEGLPTSGDRSVDCGKDMVIVFASISGMMAWRNEGIGSWMLYCLHRALKDTKEPTNILALLTSLNNQLAQCQSVCPMIPAWDAMKAIAVIIHRLQKQLLI